MKIRALESHSYFNRGDEFTVVREVDNKECYATGNYVPCYGFDLNRSGLGVETCYYAQSIFERVPTFAPGTPILYRPPFSTHTDMKVYIAGRTYWNAAGDEMIHFSHPATKFDSDGYYGRDRDIGGLAAKDWIVAPAAQPAFATGDKVYYLSNRYYIYTIGEVREEVGQLIYQGMKCGFYPFSAFTLIESAKPTPKAGDRLEVSVTGEFVSSGERYTRVNLGEGPVLIPNSAINGRPKILKPRPKPVKKGDTVTHNNVAWTVQHLLNEQWFVALQEGTQNNFKLGHINDPSFAR